MSPMLDHHDGYSPSHDEHPEPKRQPLWPWATGPVFWLWIAIALLYGTLSAVALFAAFN